MERPDEFFNQGDKAVFSKQDLRVLMSRNRTVWNLARTTTVQDFISFLTKETQLKEVTLKSKNYPIHPWGDVSPHRLALSLRKAGYLSHRNKILAPTLFIAAL